MVPGPRGQESLCGRESASGFAKERRVRNASLHDLTPSVCSAGCVLANGSMSSRAGGGKAHQVGLDEMEGAALRVQIKMKAA